MHTTFKMLLQHAACVIALFSLHLLIEKTTGAMTEDPVSILPAFIAKYSPELYQRDPLIPFQRGYITLFYDLHYGLIVALGEKWAHVLLLFSSKILFFSAVYGFGLRVFSSKWVAFLSGLLLLFPHTIMADGATLEFSYVVPESLGRSLGIFSLAFLYSRRMWLFALFAFGDFYIHAMSAVWALACGIGILVLSRKFREIGQVVALGAVILSVFLFQYTTHLPTETVPKNLVSVVARWRSSHHLFPLSWNLVEVGTQTLSFLGSAFAVCLILRRFRLSRELDFFVKFLSVTLFLWLSGFVFSEVIPLPLMYSFQFLRASSFHYIVVLVFLAGCLWLVYEHAPYKILSLFVGALVFYFFFRCATDRRNIIAMVLFLTYTLSWHRIKVPELWVPLLKGRVKSGVVILFAILTLGIFYRRIYHTHIFSRPYQINWEEELNRYYGSEFLEAARWASVNTDVSARFITSPDNIGFRYFSRRPTLMTWKDGGIVILNPEATLRFLEIFRAYGLEPPDPPRFEKITPADILRVGKRFDANFALIPNVDVTVPGNEVIYENTKWKIVRLRQRS